MSKDESRLDVLRALGRSVRDYQRAVDEMDEAATDRMGVNRSDGRALDILQEDGPLPAGELARRLSLSPGAVTTLIDRLERAGYVRRVRSTVDRRRIDVEMTERAHALVEQIYGPLAAMGAELLERYDDAELRLVSEFMRLGAEANRDAADRARSLPTVEGEYAGGRGSGLGVQPGGPDLGEPAP